MGDRGLPPLYFPQLQLHKTLQNNLKTCGYTKLSPIQQYAIPELLAGRNVLGLARVGSGKTLAFCIPLLQRLININWQNRDGLGALVVVPTRELGMQIFQVLNQIAKSMPFASGMVCGGHKYEEEARLISHVSILIATPGRLIQHLNQSHCSLGDQLQYLVFDEIDELLEKGFLSQLQEIVSYFPQPHVQKDGTLSRITAYFSATCASGFSRMLFAMSSGQFKYELVKLDVDLERCQDQDIRSIGFSNYKSNIQINDLVRQIVQISTYNPKDAPGAADRINPNLKNIVATVHEADKVDTLFSFLRQFCTSKGIIFMATCKQVQFLYQAFTKLNCGVHLLQMHSKMSQNNRQLAFYEFKKQQNCYLMTTDVAARGIDITDIQFVIQYDCPLDVQQFIHRAGRCTRFNNKGVNVIFLPEQESGFKELLQKRGIAYETKMMRIKQQISVQSAMAALVASSNQMRQLSQKAVTSYLKSIYLQKNKQVFPFERYDMTLLGRSYGLNMEVELCGGGAQEQKKPQHSDDLLVKKPSAARSAPTTDVSEQRDPGPQSAAPVTKREIWGRIQRLRSDLDSADEADRLEHKAKLKKMKYGADDGGESLEQGGEECEECYDVSWDGE